jgi:ABC-2 type transport system permease protein/ribosome-dependent ATPase
VVREKESGAIYNIYASTVTRAEFLAGKLLPGVAIALVNGIVLWALAIVVFGVPFRGSFLVFVAATAAYVLAASAAGLLVSLVVGTQQAALAVCVIAGMVVAINFSGLMTPLASLTGMTSIVARLLPPAHFNNVMHAVFLKGAAAGVPWQEMITPIAHAGLALMVAFLLFRKRVRA